MDVRLPKNCGDPVQESKLSINGYDIHYNTLKQGSREVSLYTKKTLNCLEVKFELHDDNSTDTHLELREAIWIEFHQNSQDKLLVGCLYRSPTTVAFTII